MPNARMNLLPQTDKFLYYRLSVHIVGQYQFHSLHFYAVELSVIENKKSELLGYRQFGWCDRQMFFGHISLFYINDKMLWRPPMLNLRICLIASLPYPWWTQGQSICSSKCQNKDIITLKCWKQILIALEKLKLWGFLMMLKSASCVCSGLNLFISFYLRYLRAFSTWLIQLQFLSAQAIFLCSIWCCPRSTNFADNFN